MSTALPATAAALPATSSSSAPPSSASSSPSPSSSTRARLLEDVKKDIARYVHVTLEDKARCAIASGADFGRLGLPVDVSTMERLLLGEAPCHQIIFKLSALKGGGVLGTRSKANKHGRDRMMGHSIIFPHFVMGERRGQAFSLDAIKAAFSAVRLVLVGPQDQQGQLEKAALKIYDLRVRPEVVYSFLALNHRLHGGPEPPTLEAFQRLLDLHGGLAAHLKSVHTRRVSDEHTIDV